MPLATSEVFSGGDFLQRTLSFPAQVSHFGGRLEVRQFHLLRAPGEHSKITPDPQPVQLLAACYLDTIDNHGTIFVDVDSGILSRVEKGVVPVGWMVNP